MKEMPHEERPYEKCLQYGAAVLTDAELLAVIIRTGAKGTQSLELARNILQFSPSHGGILGIHHLTVKDLMSIRGIGKVKAIQIKCIAELSSRIAKATSPQSLSFQSPDVIARHYMEEMRHKHQEELLLIALNTKNRFICDRIISKGTVNSSLVSPREIFIDALQNNAVNIIILHNHPSGDPTPSREDISITERIKEAGSIIGITLLDHIVIGDNCYVSFNEQQIL